jgi:hypothetical protein
MVIKIIIIIVNLKIIILIVIVINLIIVSLIVKIITIMVITVIIILISTTRNVRKYLIIINIKIKGRKNIKIIR